MGRSRWPPTVVASTVPCATGTTTESRVCEVYADSPPRDGSDGIGRMYRHGVKPPGHGLARHGPPPAGRSRAVCRSDGVVVDLDVETARTQPGQRSTTPPQWDSLQRVSCRSVPTSSLSWRPPPWITLCHGTSFIPAFLGPNTGDFDMSAERYSGEQRPEDRPGVRQRRRRGCTWPTAERSGALARDLRSPRARPAHRDHLAAAPPPAGRLRHRPRCGRRVPQIRPRTTIGYRAWFAGIVLNGPVRSAPSARPSPLETGSTMASTRAFASEPGVCKALYPGSIPGVASSC